MPTFRIAAANQPADRKRPDLDAFMADLDGPEARAAQRADEVRAWLADRQGKS